MTQPDAAQVTSFEGRPLPHPGEPVYDQGLQFDIDTVVSRRRLLGLAGAGVTTMVLAACGNDPATSATQSTNSTPGTNDGTTTGTNPGTTPGTVADAGSSSTTAAMATTAAPADVTDAAVGIQNCDIIPEETAGPYPGDGSNGPDVLSQSGIVRNDIRSSFGDYSGTAEGTPLDITFQIIDRDNGCVPLAGAAVYVWHCDREGDYSMYTNESQNYLRGVAEVDADGRVTFQSIFPACYSGRWPHIHFEVYPSLAEAADVANKIATSQIALPADICQQVYDSVEGYESSQSTFSQVSLESDNVFADDGGAQELGTMAGSIDGGLSVTLAATVSRTSQPVQDAPAGGGEGDGRGGPPPNGADGTPPPPPGS